MQKKMFHGQRGVEDAVVWVVQEIKSSLQDNTLIDAGHYLLQVDETSHITNQPDWITSLGFRMGLELEKLANQKKKKVTLSFLVGDFAFSELVRKEIKKSFELPIEYRRLLQAANISEKDVLLQFESQLRNRAIRNSKPFLKRGLLKKFGTLFRLNPEKTGMADIVGKASANICLPLCRFILAQKLFDEEKAGVERVINIYDERMYKCRGTFVPVYYSLYSGKIKEVINVYLLPEGGREGIFSVEIRRFNPKNVSREAVGLFDKEVEEYGK